MKVKPTKPEHAAGLIDPITRRSPFVETTVDPETHEKTTKVLDVAEVPENNFWVRRERAGEIVRVSDAPASSPAPASPAKPAGPAPASTPST